MATNRVVEKDQIVFGLAVFAGWLASLFGLIQTIILFNQVSMAVGNWNWWSAISIFFTVIWLFFFTLATIITWIKILK